MNQKTITVTQTGMAIEPYFKGQSMPLENMTSVRRPNNRYIREEVAGYFLPVTEDKKRGIFVTYLHNEIFLQELFPDYIIEHKKPNSYGVIPSGITISDEVPPREAQYQVIQQIIRMEKRDQWFVHMLHGFGKTLLSIYLMAHFKRRTLIMCYSTKVLQQWRATMEKYTDVDMDRILLIDQGKILNEIVSGTFPVKDYDIFMCTPGMLTKFGKNHGWKKLSIAIMRMRVGLKIFDEAHRNVKNIVILNALTNIDKTLYLSGDFAQSNAAHEKLYYRIFHNVPVIEPEEDLVLSMKYTIAVVVEFNSHPSEVDKASIYRNRMPSLYDYMHYEIEQDAFYRALYNVLDSIAEQNTGFKVLVLVNMVNHVNELHVLLSDRYGDKYNVGRYHGQLSEEEQEETKKNATMIVANYQSMSVGIDVSDIKYVVSCSIVGKIDDTQASGRARPLRDGSSAFYFILSDFGFPYVQNKLKRRLKYMQDTKVKEIRWVQMED